MALLLIVQFDVVGQWLSFLRVMVEMMMMMIASLQGSTTRCRRGFVMPFASVRISNSAAQQRRW